MRSFTEIKDEYLDTKSEKAEEKLSIAKDDFTYIPVPKNLSDYKRCITALTHIANRVKDIDLEYSLGELKQVINQEYGSYISIHREKEIKVNSEYEELVNKKVESLETEAKEYNQEVIDKFNKENSIYAELEKKRNELESYSDEIIDFCSAYGITTMDVEIDNSSFTIDELGGIYDEYISYMSKITRRKNPIGWFRETFDNTIFQATIFGIILLLSFTIILDIAAVLFFGAIVMNQIKAKEKMKTYSVLLGLVFNVRPLEMGFKDSIEEDKLKEEIVDEDVDDRLDSVVKEWEQALKELDQENPERLLQSIKLELVNRTDEIKEEIEILLKGFTVDKRDLFENIIEKLKMTEREFEEKKSEVKLLGDEITESSVFDTRFRLGIKEDIFEEYVTIGLSNIIIKPNKDKIKAFLQVLLANAFCNVRANNLTVTVYDPNNFGQDLVSFYNSELEKTLIFINDGLDDVIKNLKEYASNNMKDMRGKTINDFNKEAAQIGRTPKEYKLLIVLSQPKKIEDDEALTEFMSYSAELGVFVWLVTNKSIPNTKIFNSPFEGVQSPYKIDVSTFGTKVSNTLVSAIKNGKTESLLWNDFIKVAVPDEKTWTYVTDQFVDLDPGFYDGDPTQYKGYTVGNEGNVHIIGVGGTGAGKSVFLNHLIATACKKYAPNTLELWLVDYKGTEFKFYLPSKEHPYMLPHIKACLCTSDGDYAGSLYTALRLEAEKRYNFLKEVGFKNIKDYNKFLRANNRENEVVRRILFVNDEFQVIYEKAETKIIEQINKDITYISKVARAAGIHLFFTSQSMKKTVSADILQQFTLRFALRCDEEVSLSVLGTKFASEIKQKFGYLYVRSMDDPSFQSQKRYRTPYAADDVLRKFIKEMDLRAKKENMPKHDVITYEESTVHGITELDAFYEDMIASKKQIPKYGLFVLGNRMTYSTNRAPDNVVLQAVNNSHIIAAFANTVDLINFYKTIMSNVKNWEISPKLLWNSQIADLHYLCELDKDVPEELQSLSTEKQSIYDLVSCYENIYDLRVSNNEKEEPVYIILIGWDKAVGFGIDKDAMLTARFAKLLQTCGEYNIHFIFINTAVGSIGTAIIAACRYRIAGKCEEMTSYAILNSKQASKSSDMKNGYMYIWRDGEVSRAKTFVSEQTREVKKSEFVM